MSAINPRAAEYDTTDALKLARDVSWVIRSLWGALVVIIAATVWVVTLAGQVQANEDAIEKAATGKQVELVLKGIGEIKDDMKDFDERQRGMKSQLDKVEQQVQDIDKRTG